MLCESRIQRTVGLVDIHCGTQRGKRKGPCYSTILGSNTDSFGANREDNTSLPAPTPRAF